MSIAIGSSIVDRFAFDSLRGHCERSRGIERTPTPRQTRPDNQMYRKRILQSVCSKFYRQNANENVTE